MQTSERTEGAPPAADSTEGCTCLCVEHETLYDYAVDVDLAHHLAYLQPLSDDAQEVSSHSCEISPRPAQQRGLVDLYGNQRLFFSVSTPHKRLRVVARSRVLARPRHVDLEPADTPPWEEVRSRLSFRAGEVGERASEFAFPSPFIPLHVELREYALGSFTPGRPLAEAAIDLMHRIHRDFTYATASTDISTPVIEAFEQRTGVCQDFAHVLIGCLRALGLAARYVSGYLLTQPPPGQPRLIGADASHAWAAVYCPPDAAHPDAPEWIELDPTNDCLAETQHVRLAIGRDFGDVTPLRGVIQGGGQHTLLVRVTTQPCAEADAVARPKFAV